MHAEHSRRRKHIALDQRLAYPLPPCALVRACLALALFLVGMATALGLWLSVVAWWQVATALLVWLLAGYGIYRLPLYKPGAYLQWGGTQWSLRHSSAEQALNALQVAIDGQSWILLRTTESASGRTRWLLLVQASNPGRWPDMRRVLYSWLAAQV